MTFYTTFADYYEAIFPFKAQTYAFLTQYLCLSEVSGLNDINDLPISSVEEDVNAIMTGK
jgi:hypothetical protein